MILYFTGTGNSRFVANYLARQLKDQTLSLNDIFREGAPRAFASQAPFVLVAPIYAWRLPEKVEQFLAQARFTGSTKFYLVATMGDSFGNAAKYVQKILKKKGLEDMGMAGVVMPDNYLVSYPMPSLEEAVTLIRTSLPQMDQIAQAIAAQKPLPPPPSTAMGKLLSGPVNWGFSRFMATSRSFTVSERCILCGRCIAACPTKNIVLQGKSIAFGDRCMFCLGCIHRCPVHAIDYKGKAKRHGCYLCPPEGQILPQQDK